MRLKPRGWAVFIFRWLKPMATELNLPRWGCSTGWWQGYPDGAEKGRVGSEKIKECQQQAKVSNLFGVFYPSFIIGRTKSGGGVFKLGGYLNAV